MGKGLPESYKRGIRLFFGMNILIFGNNSLKYSKRGIENVILSQLEIYQEYNVYYFHWGSKNFAYKFNKIICISINNNSIWPLALNLILRRIKNKIFIHSHNPLFSVFCFKKTNILTVHDGLYYMAKSLKNKKAFLFFFIEYLLYMRVNKVHFISSFTKQKSLFRGSERFEIIFNSSHLEKIKNKDEKKNEKSNYILIVKNIEERARIDLIIEVAEKLPKKNFIIAGKGPLFEKYYTLIKIKKLNNIKMLGFVDDEKLMSLYENSNFVINLAEYGEGFGLPIIESYLFNKPILASKTCAIPEIIINKNHLVENKVDDIVNKINYLSSGSILNSENYFQYYTDNFSKNIIYSKTKEFIFSELKHYSK